MSIPLASFTFLPTGLSVQFTDLSTNIPTSWLWDFGELPTQVIQNPAHTFSAPGVYTVRLTATNDDGSTQVIKSLNVSIDPTLPLSISDIINCKMPAGISIDEICKLNYIRYWQLYLQVLVDPVISDANVFIESAWTPLANMLIAELVAYQLIQDTVSQNAVPSSTSMGVQKKIKTGPAEAEWYSNFDAGANAFAPGGVFDQLRKSVCTTASRIRVNLPMCPPLTHKPQLFRKVGRRKITRSPYNPSLG